MNEWMDVDDELSQELATVFAPSPSVCVCNMFQWHEMAIMRVIMTTTKVGMKTKMVNLFGAMNSQTKRASTTTLTNQHVYKHPVHLFSSQKQTNKRTKDETEGSKGKMLSFSLSGHLTGCCSLVLPNKSSSSAHCPMNHDTLMRKMSTKAVELFLIWQVFFNNEICSKNKFRNKTSYKTNKLFEKY